MSQTQAHAVTTRTAYLRKLVAANRARFARNQVDISQIRARQVDVSIQKRVGNPRNVGIRWMRLKHRHDHGRDVVQGKHTLVRQAIAHSKLEVKRESSKWHAKIEMDLMIVLSNLAKKEESLVLDGRIGRMRDHGSQNMLQHFTVGRGVLEKNNPNSTKTYKKQVTSRKRRRIKATMLVFRTKRFSFLEATPANTRRAPS
jgi:hypothetical protein